MILDLVPFVGDIAAAALGACIVWEARNLGMSKGQIARMAGNVGFDCLLGLIPWVGAIPDFFFRSNTRNLRSSSATSTSITRRPRSSRDRPARVTSPGRVTATQT